jgi:hypothetical protein
LTPLPAPRARSSRSQASARDRRLKARSQDLLSDALEGEPESASDAAKELLVLASDLVLAQLAGLEREPAGVARRLVDAQLLPACYSDRYDRSFLEAFHNTLQLTRNALVCDLPCLPNTASELAAHAIFRHAFRATEQPSDAVLARADAIDPLLRERIVLNGEQLAEEVETLASTVLEDLDVVVLFDAPADQDPEEYMMLTDGAAGWSLLRFENWLVPFGGAPRPRIAHDGRAWPSTV